jgi:hypothetical protein
MDSRDLLSKIEKHEAECAIRYKNIEGILEERGSRLGKLENMMIGLYGVVISGGLAIFGAVVTVAVKLI